MGHALPPPSLAAAPLPLPPSNVKLIAEAWDCDGLNQVGAFPHYGGRWSEWNGTFRDTVRGQGLWMGGPVEGAGPVEGGRAPRGRQGTS